MSGTGWTVPEGPIPGAVHGRFVPGLPWDTLPPPIWEREDTEPDPLELELRGLDSEYTTACEELDSAEEEVRECESRKWDLEKQIRAKLADYAKVAPGPAAALAKELDLPGVMG